MIQRFDSKQNKSNNVAVVQLTREWTQAEKSQDKIWESPDKKRQSLDKIWTKSG